MDLDDAHAKRDALQTELNGVPKFLSVDAAGPQVIVAGKSTGARARLEEARAKLGELGAQYTDKHPDIIALRQQIRVLEAQVARLSGSDEFGGGGRKAQIANPVYDKVKVNLVDAETVLASTERRLKQAEQEQRALDEKARAAPGVQAQAQDLDRDYAVKKKNFDELLQRREQARIGEAADTKADMIQFRIIDPPLMPVVPVAPNQPLLLSSVLAVAVAAAIALPLLLIQFDQSHTTVTSLRALGFPVLGSVSRLRFAAGGRRTRVQVAALCASATVLLVVYGLLLATSVRLYQLGFI